MSLRVCLVLSLVTALSMGCSQTAPPDQPKIDSRQSAIRVRNCSGPATSLAPDLAAALPPRDGSMQPDDQYAELAKEVPGGFAGVIYDSGRPVLFLTDTSQAAAAKRALASRLSGFDVAGADVRAARWDFAQLVDWYNYLLTRSELWGAPGMVSGDKDESTNRIHFGVLDEATRDRMARALENVPVPCDLVLLSIESRPVLLDQLAPPPTPK